MKATDSNNLIDKKAKELIKLEDYNHCIFKDNQMPNIWMS